MPTNDENGIVAPARPPLGGWLWLVFLVFPVGVVGALREARWELFELQTDAVDATWRAHKYFELTSNVVMAVLCVALVVLFLGRRRSFPRVAIFAQGLHIALLLVKSVWLLELPGASRLPGPWLMKLWMVVGNVALIVYFTRSRRVRSVFVR